jgi:hypothetical protein
MFFTVNMPRGKNEGNNPNLSGLSLPDLPFNFIFFWQNNDNDSGKKVGPWKEQQNLGGFEYVPLGINLNWTTGKTQEEFQSYWVGGLCLD